MTQLGETLTDRERLALESGHACLYRGRVIPIIRGGEETDEEKAAREAAEAQAAADTEAAKNKTFTQTDVDRIVQERLARERKDRPTEDEIKQLRDKATKLDELETANQSELDRERTARENAEKERDSTLAEAKEIRLRAAIVAEAAKPDRKVVDTADVVALLDRSTLELDADGIPTNLAKAMDSLLEAKPHLVASNGGSRGDADQGARGGVEQLAREDLKTMKPEDIVKAREEGRLATVMGATT